LKFTAFYDILERNLPMEICAELAALRVTKGLPIK